MQQRGWTKKKALVKETKVGKLWHWKSALKSKGDVVGVSGTASTSGFKFSELAFGAHEKLFFYGVIFFRSSFYDSTMNKNSQMYFCCLNLTLKAQHLGNLWSFNDKWNTIIRVNVT